MKIGTEGWQLGCRVPDHRGSRVQLKRVIWWRLSKEDKKAIQGSPWIKKMRPLYLASGVLIYISIWVTQQLTHSLGLRSWLDFLLMVAAACITGHLLSLIKYVPLLEWHVQKRLGSGQCPSCQYDLIGLIAETDGCAVCPECGAAWKLESKDA
ncbi:MAG: hypothetical protein Phyf2KO_11930 [Phycisphaerales bacterium]